MTFEAFAQAAGLLLDRAIPDGRIHRVPTALKPRKRNGCYKFDGVRGWAIAWDAAGEVEIYRETHPDPAAIAAARRRARDEAAKRDLEYEHAAMRAKEIVASATYGSHPYFARKGLAGEKGLVAADGRLVVPMRNWRTQDLQSVQFIAEDGEKKFLPRGKAEGAAFAIGPRFGPVWLAEGLATGLSIRKALSRLFRTDRVLVCFSAHNLRVIGEQIGRPAFVIADHDHINPSTGKRAGEDAAKATGLPYAMSPVEGEDFNDFCTRAGIQAGASMLRNLIGGSNAGTALQ